MKEVCVHIFGNGPNKGEEARTSTVSTETGPSRAEFEVSTNHMQS